ncbi:MAG: hypothetical protein B7Z58_11930 [Acidiphilium sp. 37-64-53]|uniref:hypothetical protein n=1 Tax=Acidiphilium TaxID=522 RepID=UPI000BC6D9EA|nr:MULTISPECIES: hypothetical protein [Acidiphilium]OYW01313.1 MAG: hypothetical protein B7Z58_11930 [Acidiphilium sp. 37-64-53]OZB28883.1 MAG: hypothetical protein B7X49_09125 [Acidiphilium sp. 34-64-41]HQT85974.1 hypothetical protein [Acidiphilium rubrum]
MFDVDDAEIGEVVDDLLLFWHGVFALRDRHKQFMPVNEGQNCAENARGSRRRWSPERVAVKVLMTKKLCSTERSWR